MRWSKYLVAVVLVIHVVFLGIGAVPVVIWGGGFDLTVHVQSQGAPPTEFAYEIHPNRAIAEYAIEIGKVPAEGMWSGAYAGPYDGKPITIPIPVSGKDSLFGWELERTQFTFLAVRARMPDGRQVSKVVEIPDGRKTRDVYITLP